MIAIANERSIYVYYMDGSQMMLASSRYDGAETVQDWTFAQLRTFLLLGERIIFDDNEEDT